MNTEDTEGILQECDAGVKTALDSIDAVIDRTNNEELRKALKKSRTEHVQLANEITTLLDEHGLAGKDQNGMAKLMTHTKIAAELLMEPTDATVAELMIDGCNMGVKSLSRYLNQYKAADEESKDIAKKLIHLEAQLSADLRSFL